MLLRTYLPLSTTNLNACSFPQHHLFNLLTPSIIFLLALFSSPTQLTPSASQSLQVAVQYLKTQTQSQRQQRRLSFFFFFLSPGFSGLPLLDYPTTVVGG
ncbi:hypothetical protein LZ32DRAFT_363046 [Colletotrichum eremochloae]|nr:hypothetical protein LZ32DRAFT_363046 [Colletotrichum eremochloae]